MTLPSGPNLCLVVVYFNAHNIADSQTNQHFHHHGCMLFVIDIDIAFMIIVIDIDDGVITITATTDDRFAERNVLGKPMSRAIQNDIQNIQKMLDKDIEDSSLSGKTPKISLPLYFPSPTKPYKYLPGWQSSHLQLVRTLHKSIKDEI